MTDVNDVLAANRAAVMDLVVVRLTSILRITSVLHSVALDCTRARSAVLHFVYSFSSIGFAAIRLLDESERGGFVTEKALRFSMLQKKWAR